MSAKRTRIASSSSSSDGDNNSFMFNQVLPPAPTTDFWCNPGMVPVNVVYAMPVPVAPMMFWPCMAPASGGAPVKMESSQPQLGSFLERCHLCKKWIGDNDVYMYGVPRQTDPYRQIGADKKQLQGSKTIAVKCAWCSTVKSAFTYSQTTPSQY
ncbi:hypothetical protein SO802_033762 [Lithocarpus litseifolius]|uniref:FLZ-type domain-containing protein n=1 Tax=Lithocarpus litseifolius TaxID=425828 RepID=A0AAW2BEN9_9ROSI